MKISVVIPCYNYEKFLAAAIDSVLDGDRPPDEVIVVDDGSVDGSARIAESYPDVTLVRKANGGMASALNAGVAEAVGDVVVFLDADDRASPGRLAWIERSFEDPAVCMAWHPLTIESSNHTNKLLLPSSPLPHGDLGPSIATHGLTVFALTSGIAIRRTALDAVGAIPEEQFRISSEGFFVRTLPFVGRVAAATEPLGVYRSHAGSQIRAITALDVPSVASKLDNHLAVADTEHALLSSAATAAGHPVTVERLRVLDQSYLDYHRWHARLVAPRRRGAWRSSRELAVDFPWRLAHRRIVRLVAICWSVLLPRRAAMVSFLIRHDFDLTGAVRQTARLYWFQKALRMNARGRVKRLRRSRCPR